jgi:putative phosphoesterase
MRVALIGDIHGNGVALDTVLERIAIQKIDRVICLGDVAATGPQPREVIARLRDIDCPVVMGNMDAWLLQPQLREQSSQRGRYWQDTDVWCAQQISENERVYLRTFQASIEYVLPSGKKLFCYHGSPRSYSERIEATTPEEVLELAFAGIRGNVLVGGHTHIQMFRRFRDKLLVNPGSVGLAMDRIAPTSEIRQAALAEYAVIESDEISSQVALHRVAFDLEAFIDVIKGSGMPHAEWWIRQWQKDM